MNNGAPNHYLPLSYAGHGSHRAAPPTGYEAFTVNMEWLAGGVHPSKLTHPPGYTQEMSWERARGRQCLCPCNKN